MDSMQNDSSFGSYAHHDSPLNIQPPLPADPTTTTEHPEESRPSPLQTILTGFPEVHTHEHPPSSITGEVEHDHDGEELAAPPLEGDSAENDAEDVDNGARNELGLLMQEIYVPRSALVWPNAPRLSMISLPEVDDDYADEHGNYDVEEDTPVLYPGLLIYDE